jgi:hypothetical protein
MFSDNLRVLSVLEKDEGRPFSHVAVAILISTRKRLPTGCLSTEISPSRDIVVSLYSLSRILLIIPE